MYEPDFTYHPLRLSLNEMITNLFTLQVRTHKDVLDFPSLFSRI